MVILPKGFNGVFLRCPLFISPRYLSLTAKIKASPSGVRGDALINSMSSLLSLVLPGLRTCLRAVLHFAMRSFLVSLCSFQCLLRKDVHFS